MNFIKSYTIERLILPIMQGQFDFIDLMVWFHVRITNNIYLNWPW